MDDAATAKGDLQITETTKAEDEKKLEDCLTSCHARAVEFEQNQVLRAEEVKAIEEALCVYVMRGCFTGVRGGSSIELRVRSCGVWFKQLGGDMVLDSLSLSMDLGETVLHRHGVPRWVVALPHPPRRGRGPKCTAWKVQDSRVCQSGGSAWACYEYWGDSHQLCRRQNDLPS